MTKEEIAAKVAEIGDACVFKGTHDKAGDWVVILKAPLPPDWDYYLANRESPSAKTMAGVLLVKSMLAHVSPSGAKPIPGQPQVQADFDALCQRLVALPQAIFMSKRFDRFIGLEIDAEEKG